MLMCWWSTRFIGCPRVKLEELISADAHSVSAMADKNVAPIPRLEHKSTRADHVPGDL